MWLVGSSRELHTRVAAWNRARQQGQGAMHVGMSKKLHTQVATRALREWRVVRS